MSNFLYHYGTPRHSGRYPWGSGDDPEQRNKSFLGYVDNLKKQGVDEVDIAKGLGISTSQLRARKTLAKAEQRKASYAEATKLKDKGYSNVEIGRRMGINESSVRSLLNPALQQRSEIADLTANILRDSVDKQKYVDVGSGVENHLGVSRTKLKASIEQLKEEGYTVHYVPDEQLGTGKKTSIMVLAAPETPYSEVYKNKAQIKVPTVVYSENGERSALGLQPPVSVDSKRIKIRYAEDGGIEKDGVIELRRGAEDLSLGNAKYAQVRIGVDGTHYLKGMAMYSDNMPDGVDIVFNTNKHTGTPQEKVFKPMKTDKDNPFGASIKPEDDLILAQRYYVDSKGNKKLSPINIVNEEGDWGKWSKTLSSQMLSKQSPSLAKKQLELAYDSKKEEYDEIMSLTNPAVKKKLLDSFADDCDSASVHLKAAALPRQGAHVILPFPDMKETEIYAPNYRDGEKVVLVRYPHGGPFEIPQLTVNNKHASANKVIHNARDAVGINSKVAERLSGADFDGDTVLVIPNPKGEIKTASPLKGLANFDPKEAYPAYEGMPKISPRTKQMKMGDVSNLITDMTIKGADADEIARAVRHSMVVIDSEKHNLNYKKSYVDNGIAELKKKYQGGERNGASTLISRASSEVRVGARKEKPADSLTGKKVYEYTGETYTKNGKQVPRTITSTKMAEAEDAFELSSGTPMETIYAAHANRLKMLANNARKASIATEFTKYSPSARETYAPEVASLKSQLNIALKNRPLERQAQLLANAVVSAKRQSNPDMDAADVKKIKGQALAAARVRTGAKKQRINITDKEWEAIQAGAVSTNTLTQILNNTDLDKVKQLATPRTALSMTPSKIARAKAMLASGYSQAEIADALGVSTRALSEAVN
jgi:DNA-binding CsgD family transcriptional regulator